VVNAKRGGSAKQAAHVVGVADARSFKNDARLYAFEVGLRTISYSKPTSFSHSFKVIVLSSLKPLRGTAS
jgi:hypothetical protein